MAKQYILNEELLQITLNYLASKPYAEVANLINELQKIEQLPKGKEKSK